MIRDVTAQDWTPIGSVKEQLKQLILFIIVGFFLSFVCLFLSFLVGWLVYLLPILLVFLFELAKFRFKLVESERQTDRHTE